MNRIRRKAQKAFKRCRPYAFALHLRARENWPTEDLLGAFAIAAVNINKPHQIHRDRKDPKESASVVAYSGRFEGGAVAFPTLMCLVRVVPGSLLLFRGRLLPHAALPWSGERIATIYTSHENSLKA